LKRPNAKGNKPPEAIPLDIKRDIPQTQLAAIGALALAFNELEATVDKLFFASTGLPQHLQLEISTRINGIDGTIEIIKASTKYYFSEAEQRQLEDALGATGFHLMKNYRDCVIHARHLNFSTNIGIKVDRRARIYDVLVTQAALDAAFNIMDALRWELFSAFMLVSALKAIKDNDPAYPKKPQLEAYAANYRALFLANQRERRSLPPIPEFPSESELREAEDQFQLEKLRAAWDFARKINGHPPSEPPTFLARRGGGREKPESK
jgi:hypothetical protein